MNAKMTEIVIVTLQGYRDHPRQNDRTEQDTTGACFQLAAQFFDRKGNAGQRCVERGSNARSAAGENEIFAADDSGIGQIAVKEMHD
ncbi:hypothetical protein D9M73_208280 [compost metagenome]